MSNVIAWPVIPRLVGVDPGLEPDRTNVVVLPVVRLERPRNRRRGGMQRALEQARLAAQADQRAQAAAQDGVAAAMADKTDRFNPIAEIRRTVRNQRPLSGIDLCASEWLRAMFKYPAG